MYQYQYQTDYSGLVGGLLAFFAVIVVLTVQITTEQ